MKKILTDSCFWIALYDTKDEPGRIIQAEQMAEKIERHRILIPFPTLYEFVNSRLGRRDSRDQFRLLLSRANVYKVGDRKYKDKALSNFFMGSRSDIHDISLVDEILKLIIQDPQMDIDFIASFDEGLVNQAIAHNIKDLRGQL